MCHILSYFFLHFNGPYRWFFLPRVSWCHQPWLLLSLQNDIAYPNVFTRSPFLEYHSLSCHQSDVGLTIHAQIVLWMAHNNLAPAQNGSHLEFKGRSSAHLNISTATGAIGNRKNKKINMREFDHHSGLDKHSWSKGYTQIKSPRTG